MKIIIDFIKHLPSMNIDIIIDDSDSVKVWNLTDALESNPSSMFDERKLRMLQQALTSLFHNQIKNEMIGKSFTDVNLRIIADRLYSGWHHIQSQFEIFAIDELEVKGFKK